MWASIFGKAIKRARDVGVIKDSMRRQQQRHVKFSTRPLRVVETERAAGYSRASHSAGLRQTRVDVQVNPPKVPLANALEEAVPKLAGSETITAILAGDKQLPKIEIGYTKVGGSGSGSGSEAATVSEKSGGDGDEQQKMKKRMRGDRFVCFRRTGKLFFFIVIFIIAILAIICLYTVSGTNLQIAIIILMAAVAILMIVEYLVWGTDCLQNPRTGEIGGPGGCKAPLEKSLF